MGNENNKEGKPLEQPQFPPDVSEEVYRVHTEKLFTSLITKGRVGVDHDSSSSPRVRQLSSAASSHPQEPVSS
jgi:hypothetical protein